MKKAIYKTNTKLLIVFTLLMAVLLVLSSNLDVSAQTTPPPASKPAILSMSLTITPPSSPTPTTPPSTAPVTEFDIVVTIQTSGFNIVDYVGQANAPGEGHLIYYFDAEPPTFPNRAAFTEEGNYYWSTFIPFTWLSATPGYHNLAVQLVNNDDTPLNPPVFAQMRTYLQSGTATATTMPTILSFGVQAVPPSSPTPTPTVTPAPAPRNYFDVAVTAQVSGFNLVRKYGEAAAPGEGHLIYYEDTAPWIYPGSSAARGSYYATTAIPFTWLNATSGYQTYSVQLVNNDDTPLDLPVFAQIQTNLEIGATTTPTPAPSPRPTISPTLTPTSSPLPTAPPAPPLGPTATR